MFKPLKKTIFWTIVTSVILIISVSVIPLVSSDIIELMTMKGTVAGNLKAMGLSYSSIILLAIFALIQTSLSEEILFRGFIAKRLINWLGFKPGILHKQLSLDCYM